MSGSRRKRLDEARTSSPVVPRSRAGTPAGARADEPGERPERFVRTGRRVLGLLRPNRWLAAGVVAMGTASIVTNVSGPAVLGHATDLIFSGYLGRRYPAGESRTDVVNRLRAEDSGLAKLVDSVDFVPGQGIDAAALRVTLLAALVLYAVSGLCWVLQGRLATTLVQRTVLRLREEVEAKLSRLPLSYFDDRSRGEVLSRTTNDVDNLAQSMQQTLSQITNSFLLLVGVLGMMFWISPMLALVALVAVPMSVVSSRLIGGRAQRQFARQWKTTGELNGHVEEMYTGHALVRLYGQREASRAAFRARNEALFHSSFRAQFTSGSIGPVTLLVGNLSYVLVAVIGGLQVASGSLSIGSVQAFVQYSRQFTQPLLQVANLSNLVQSGVASAARIFELLDADEEPATSPATSPPPAAARGQVRFEEVSFRYRPEEPLIEGLSLTVEPGQLVAIVGPTGAGKTTVVNLLMRFYDVTAGRITVDGVDIREMDRARLRSRVGMVLQDAWLFGGTIRENIAYGREDATPEAILDAARAAQVDHFVRTLSQGYDTRIDDQGPGLSAGEKQLVTIARALLADPPILILDEATSSVDTRTEVLIQRAMARLSRGRTSFVIAHRLSTIRNADLILMMEHGAIVERGTHRQLLAADGRYARLYAAQFAAPLAQA